MFAPKIVDIRKIVLMQPLGGQEPPRAVSVEKSLQDHLDLLKRRASVTLLKAATSVTHHTGYRPYGPPLLMGRRIHSAAQTDNAQPVNGDRKILDDLQLPADAGTGWRARIAMWKILARPQSSMRQSFQSILTKD